MYRQTFFVIARPERENEPPGPRFLCGAGWISDPMKARQWGTAEEALEFQVMRPGDGCAYRVDLTIDLDIPGPAT